MNIAYKLQYLDYHSFQITFESSTHPALKLLLCYKFLEAE